MSSDTLWMDHLKKLHSGNVSLGVLLPGVGAAKGRISALGKDHLEFTTEDGRRLRMHASALVIVLAA